MRHYARHDFIKLLMENGVSRAECYSKCLDVGITHIAKKCAQMIYERDLSELTPIQIHERVDTSSHKVRQIGREGALQQVLDYVAVYSAKEILQKRIVMHQASSIKGRGQIYGLRIIKKWIHNDNCYAEHCARHHYHCSPKTKYFVKLDAEKCYPNMRYQFFMKHFRRDCANDDLVWLWEELLKSHQVGDYKGFMIGALISQWSVQYCFSFAYRFAMSIRNKRVPEKTAISHMLIYMDDMLLFGSNRRELLSAVKEIIAYMKSEFGISIKDSYSIIKFDENNPVDMLGYTFHRSSKISLRERNFIRIRRMIRKYNITLRIDVNSARRFVSYGGMFKYSNTIRLERVYHHKDIFNQSRKEISLSSNIERRAA